MVHVPRIVPVALQPKLEAALDEMEKKGIISKVEGFTPLDQLTCDLGKIKW